jgi:GNAT superfamily N-acetyltransferase
MAARIDRTELALVLGFADSVRRAGRQVDAWPIGGSSAVLGELGSPFNKLIALGFDGVPEPAELDAVEQAHASRGAPLQVELSTLADPATGRLLTARGYRLVGFENVLGRRLDDVTVTSANVRIDEIGTGEARLWIETVADAFLHPDVFDGPPSHEAFDRTMIERAYEDTAGVAGMSRLLARLDGVVAGGAAMYVRDSTALLCGAATLPPSRRRGVQSALLRARLLRAREAGCDLAVVTTQPGSKSQENVQRAGFELLYSRAVLVKAPDGS